MKLNSFFWGAIMIGLLLTSCNSDDDGTPLPKGDYENGILISHEGTTTGVSGSVSYVSDDLIDSEQDVYKATNGEDLGTFQQSIGFNGELAFIVVDNANTITVVNRYTFEKVGSITTELKTPRYIGFANGKGYVTNWGDTGSATDDFIAVVDLSDYTVSSTIPVSEGPEQIVEKNGNLYVSHKGGFSSNNVLTVLDITGNTTTEIEVADNPDELVFDETGNLWVLCGGKFGETAGALVKINTNDNTVVSTMSFSGTDNPELMTYANGKFYYTLNAEVFVWDASSSSLPTEPIISKYFYGIAVKDNSLYLLNAKDFASAGTLDIYDLTTDEETKSIDVGFVPAKIYFN